MSRSENSDASRATGSASASPQIEQRLIELGVESETARAAKRIVPWIISVGVHLGLVVLGFLITWTVVLLQDDDAVVIQADFYSATYDPVVMLDLPQAEDTEQTVQDRVDTTSIDQAIDEQLNEFEMDPISLIASGATESPLAQFAPEAKEGRAEFVGLSTSNARHIVYVIDASGSMMPTLPVVTQELARSLQGLTSSQQFAVMFFQGNDFLAAPPRNRLVPATEEEKLRVLSWIDENVIPGGRSNPLAAIEAALRLQPDVIFLLSDNITGSGQFEIDQRALLQRLDELNPVDERLGRRRTQINCIQFLDPDPLDTLRKIAEAHGGARGYKFLDRAELGLAPAHD